MPYLTSFLWKLPKLTTESHKKGDAAEPDSPSILAAACRDCGNYNFPPKPHCRYCGSPRIRTVSVAPDPPAAPKWRFSPSSKPTKPN